MEDSARIRYTNMLTARMRFARQAQTRWAEAMADEEHPVPGTIRPIMHAADEEVRAMIRQIAVAANFNSETIDQITEAAWRDSKDG